MFLLILCGALAWAAYQLFQYNMKSGTETLRAHSYLAALLRGEAKDAAQSLVSGSMQHLGTEAIQHIVNEIRIVHGGRQLPLVAEAYRRGMASKMPKWYQWSASQADPTLSIMATYTTPLTMREREPLWVKSFIVFFALSRFKDEPKGQMPGTVLIPDDLINLMDGTVSSSLEASLPASLTSYMAFSHPKVRDYRADFVMVELRRYLNITFRKAVQSDMIISAVKQNYAVSSGAAMTDNEVQDFMVAFERHQAQGSKVVHLVYGMSMMSILEQEFEACHSISYHLFNEGFMRSNDQHTKTDVRTKIGS